MKQTVKDIAKELRAHLLEIEKRVRALADHEDFKEPQSFAGQHGEMIAQSKLALRAVEDARMRLGKVLQYGRDGVSIYDRTEAP